MCKAFETAFNAKFKVVTKNKKKKKSLLSFSPGMCSCICRNILFSIPFTKASRISNDETDFFKKMNEQSIKFEKRLKLVNIKWFGVVSLFGRISTYQTI